MSGYSSESIKRVVLYMTYEDFDNLREQAKLRCLVVPTRGTPSISAYVRLIARRYYRVVKCKRTKTTPGLSAWEHSLLDNRSDTTVD